jgi:hypothetical protein
MTKTANQLYKESNTELSFKDWIEEEKNKGVMMTNKVLEDVINPVLESASEVEETSELDTSKTSFGIPKWVLFTGATLIVASIGYKIYKNRK